MKIRIFSETKANNHYYKNTGNIAAWNNPNYYEYIEVPEDTDIEIMLDRDYLERSCKAATGEKVERHTSLQAMLDESNRDNFNSWRAAHRHISGPKLLNGEEIVSDLENLQDTRQSEEIIVERINDEAVLEKVRIVLKDKPEWADLVIEIVIKEKSIREYAAEVGKDESGVGKMLKRALKRLKNYF